MKLKNEKGITLLTLVITVVLLIILAYATISIGINIGGTAKFENVKTYMLLIKTKSETVLNEKLIEDKDEMRVNLYGTRVTDSDSPYYGLYKLNQKELNAMGVKGAKENDGYYIDYGVEIDESGNIENIDDTSQVNRKVDVMYEKGVSDGVAIYHKLSEMN